MPTYQSIKWNGYNVYIYPDVQDALRRLPVVARIVPYFWENEINLDMVAYAPRGAPHGAQKPLRYKWELRDSDDKVIKSDQDSYEFQPLIKSLTKIRKQRAIKVGFLKPQQCYRLNVTLTDSLGNTSESLPIAIFTIKDKDEFRMQMALVVFAVVMALIFSLLFRGCT